MRILQLIYESLGSPFGFGGAGVRAYEIYKRLKDRHEVTLLCMRYPGAVDGEMEGLRHIFVGTESKSLTKSVLAYTVMASNYVRMYGENYDIIVENFLPSTPFFARFLTNIPVILQIQGVMERHSFKKFNPLYAVPMYVVEGFYPRLYDRFIFASDVTRGKVLPKDARRIKMCHVIPNGINEELLRVTPEDGDYMLFFSRIDVYTKGLDILIEAFERIAVQYPELRLILAGYEFDRFNKLLSGCHSFLKGRIHYAGFVTGEDKMRLLSGAKMVVLPSRHESSPISIIEAAACGKPVIVSDIPELRFVQEEGFGLCFHSGSKDGLAEKLRVLLGNDKMREEMGRQGREFSRRFLWDSIATQFENVLNHVVTPEG
ncbi:MAG: glycosyltransferase family 4 protein [Thermodesulfovibrionales bacterium]